MVDYRKRLTEVEVILKHLSKKDFAKIPKDLVNLINKNKDNQYIWYYDETKELKNQDVNKDTIAILSYINIKYLLNEKQKQFIQQIHNENEQKHQKELRNMYNPNDIFKNNKIKTAVNEETNLTIIEKQKWYNKIFNRIRTLLKKK